MRKSIKQFFAGIVVMTMFAGSSDTLKGADDFSAKVNGDIYGQIRVVGDVDGDGQKDLVFGATDGKIHLFSANGSEIFRPPYWPKSVDSPVLAGVEVADLKGNGSLSVIASSMEGTVYCISSSGKEKWKYSTGGEIRISTPLVADMVGAGEYDVIINSSSGKVVWLTPDGDEKQVLNMDHPVDAAPVAIDTDKDGVKNLVVKDSSGKISIFNENGHSVNEWFTRGYGQNVWPFNIDAADIDGNGSVGIFTADGNSGDFTMWSPDGKVINSFKLSDGSHGAPRIADIDGDGVNDIIIAQADGRVIVCDKKGNVKKGWPYVSGKTIYGPPAIIDIDGDGYEEVVFTATSFGGKDISAGCVIALNKDGKIIENYPKYVGKTFAPPTFADLDGDGYLEMVVAGGIGFTGNQLHLFKTKARVRTKIVVMGQETTFK